MIHGHGFEEQFYCDRCNLDYSTEHFGLDKHDNLFSVCPDCGGPCTLEIDEYIARMMGNNEQENWEAEAKRILDGGDDIIFPTDDDVEDDFDVEIITDPAKINEFVLSQQDIEYAAGYSDETAMATIDVERTTIITPAPKLTTNASSFDDDDDESRYDRWQRQNYSRPRPTYSSSSVSAGKVRTGVTTTTGGYTSNYGGGYSRNYGSYCKHNYGGYGDWEGTLEDEYGYYGSAWYEDEPEITQEVYGASAPPPFKK